MQLHMQADGMSRKSIVGLLFIILLINCFINFVFIDNSRASSVLPKFYVDDDYDESTPGWLIDHFDNIQSAISASSSGDRIIVYEGTYTESLTIYHQLDIFGEDKEITIIDGENINDVISINAENVNISHFTIKNSGSSGNNSVIKINSGNAIITDNIITGGKQGITLNNCNNNIIYDNGIYSNSGDGLYFNHSDSNQIIFNSFTDNNNGLFLYTSSYNEIENNSNIKSNSANGIFLNESSNYNTLHFNNLSSNSLNGIFLNDHCDHNTIQKNDIYSNSDSGIRCENSSTNNFKSNIVNSNLNYGTLVVGSYNRIQYNDINYNSEHGVFLFADDNNIISNNTIKGNIKNGIHLSNSTNDNIYANEICNNLIYGINLDYFSIDNLIYNNYFHHNSENAMDKSLGNNFWNTTNTIGTNIIGGTIIFGNYWDDYDEISEGSYDNDNDGIADSPYTIYTVNNDYGPILDTNPPVIGIPSANPDLQTIGSYTNISVTITDNTEIKNVFLVVTDPNGATTNFSILQNRTGDTFYCNKQFNPVGNFTFYIFAKDPRNWQRSINKRFEIEEGQAPTITDNSPNTGSPDSLFTFNATVIDDNDGPLELTVKVDWSHGDNSGNTTMYYMGENYFELPVYLDKTTADLSYKYYAIDKWGNTIITDLMTITITDLIPPTIIIDKHEYSSDGVIHTYTIGTTITDETTVVDVFIEYWKTNENHLTVEMDKITDSYYEKIIRLNNPEEKIYCIINATDTSGNEANTKNPYADSGGPYNGVVSYKITFNASASYDLDGNISQYYWDFGDGITAMGEITQHEFLTNGNYTVKLTVTDNDDLTKTVTTYAAIIQSIKIQTSNTILNQINSNYGTDLTLNFYSYDTDGDSIVDIFVDPNEILKTIPVNLITVEDNVMFVISTNDDSIPEFFWNATTDEIININHIKFENIDNYYIPDDKQAMIILTLEKDGWICVDIEDRHPNSNIIISTESKNILQDMIWRENNRIYFLDDPDVTYTILFEDIYPDVTSPTFTPDQGQIIGKYNPEIIIKYDIEVIVTSASFGDFDITSDLETYDSKTYYYKPPGYLEEDYYLLEITAIADYGGSSDTSSIEYYFEPYTSPPPPVEKNMIEKYMIWIMLLLTIGIGGVIYTILKRKGIAFESFIYIKNKKIFPFFKPVVFGPLRIDVNEPKVNKAEFFVNGKLKDTLTEEPFIWNWNEPAFMGQKIETKVYDENGKSSSSGEMTFYIFNRPRFFK